MLLGVGYSVMLLITRGWIGLLVIHLQFLLSVNRTLRWALESSYSLPIITSSKKSKTTSIAQESGNLHHYYFKLLLYTNTKKTLLIYLLCTHYVKCTVPCIFLAKKNPHRQL